MSTESVLAYLMLKVEPPHSPMVAEKILELNARAAYSAAVWGRWDVVAKVEADSADEFLRLVGRLYDETSVVSVDIYFAKMDQCFSNRSEARGDRFAFVLLTIEPQQIGAFVEHFESKSAEYPIIFEGCEVRGAHNVILTLSFGSDQELANFVMRDIQSAEQEVQESLTVLAIEGMFWRPR